MSREYKPAHHCFLQVSTFEVHGYIHLRPHKRCESWWGINVAALIPCTAEPVHPSRDKRKWVLILMLNTWYSAMLTCFSAFDTRTVMANDRKLQLYLISRRSRFRAGTRYFRRGVDHDGHVANFNETEQIAIVPSQADSNEAATTLSFVQIRGSIPVFWAEINNLHYRPDLQIMDLQDSVRT
jgi:SacI homology domain